MGKLCAKNMKQRVPSKYNVRHVFEQRLCPVTALKPLERHQAFLRGFALLQNKAARSKIYDLAPGHFGDFQGGRTKACLVQGKDDNVEKRQNGQYKACCTLYFEGAV